MTTDDVGALFRNPATPGTILLFILVDELGTEFLSWENETIEHEIMAKWKVRPAPENDDKIQALITVLTSNMFYANLDCFVHICNSLNDAGASFEHFDPPQVSDIAWAIAETTLIDPPETKDQSYRFSHEITAYMEAELEREGFTKPPRILAKFVSVPDNETQLNQILDGDGIEYKAYWTDQERKRVDVDQYVASKLATTLELLADLPLHHADKKALEELRQRARTALAGQSKSIQQESESASPRSLL
jgi:hypothetical protein